MSVVPEICQRIDGKRVLKAADSGLAEYARAIRANIYRLWAGYAEIWDFDNGMAISIRRGFTRAWHQGAAEMGIKPGELTEEEEQALARNINSDISYVFRFGQDIVAGSKENGGLLRVQQRRGELWINRYNAVRNEARVMAGKNRKLRWVWNPLKEHCSDCGRLNGRVYRARVWDEYGIVPQSPALECEGWRCGCQFIQTDAPVTPGRPPNIGGL